MQPRGRCSGGIWLQLPVAPKEGFCLRVQKPGRQLPWQVVPTFRPPMQRKGNYAKQCTGHQQWVGVQVCDVFCVLAAMELPLTCSWRPSMWTPSCGGLVIGAEVDVNLRRQCFFLATRDFFFPHLLPSSSPICTLVPLHYFRQSTVACGKAVMRAAAADQAGNDGLEGGVRGKLLGFRRDLSVVPSRSVSSVLDTLTPEFELYVRLRERRQVLRPKTLEVPGMDLQLCVCRFDPFEVCPSVGTVVTAVVVCGVPKWWHSFGYG
ncbi:hypothetical protein Taro_016855 [Colocasia esculenta]|uniref:Uncharacterized protein n=1 Tax=Colocasia esculenta TaxID=4460 RepID=A0A843ULY4_COLES|nr:hypothetical protein [Colocasia esculenta]